MGLKHLSLGQRDERSLRVSENTVMRRIFSPNGKVVTFAWRKMCNEELNNISYSSSIIITYSNDVG
jgi:hypothetical protein